MRNGQETDDLGSSKQGFWKTAGWTGMTVLPMVTDLMIQVVIMNAVAFVIAVALAVQAGLAGPTDVDAMQQAVMDAVMGNQGIILLLCQGLGLLVFGLWYYFGCRRRMPRRTGRAFTGRIVLTAVLMGLLVDISSNALLLSAEYVVPELIRHYEELMESAGMGVDPLVIFVSICIAPVGEELLCRGVTFHYAQRIVGGMKNRRAAFWIANTIQALIFGILHLNLVQGTYAFYMGLCFGWLRHRYNSLIPSMLAHFTVNFSSSFFIGLLFLAVPESLPVYLVIMFAGIAATIALMVSENNRILRCET